MATQSPQAGSEQAEPRDAKGEWRPDYPCRYAPVFTWPPRPLAILRWIVSWPGFMWPTNLGLFAIAALSWLYTEPDVARCTHFEGGWLAQIYLRNLALIWLVYGGYHLYLYIWKAEGTRTKYDSHWPASGRKIFLFKDQVLDNIFWTCGVAGLIWTVIEALTLWLYANHRIPSFAWKQHPVWFVVWIFAIPFWREFHFYWVHRLIHWKPFYKHVHYLHHKNVNPNPWSGMAMHPVEIVIYLSVSMIHWIVPSSPFHFFFNLQHAGLAPASVHHGFEGPILKGKLPTGSYFHYLHHRYFECNYGAPVLPFDRWFHTFRDGLPDGEGSGLQEEHR
jgi:sterol desaturase/sphingolipid hydroxylase (fatty acid hydroxylase superfamily)